MNPPNYFMIFHIGYKVKRCLAIMLVITAAMASTGLSFAQHAVITGKVTDKSDNKPVPFANVYFNNSQNGTTTDPGGNYALKNLDAGVYVFIVSFVGYESFRKTVRLGVNDTITINVSLAPSLTQLSEVEVRGKADAEWRRQFRKFESDFFGPDITSKDCEILNRSSLSFYENPRTDSFTAESKVPLEIINHRLGYKIYFTLKQFCIYKGSLSIYYGDVRFERLAAESSGQLSAWEMNRYNAYRGSLRNFFKDLIDNTLEKDGFNAYLVQPSISYMRTNYFSEKLGKELVPLDRKSMLLFGLTPNTRNIVSNMPIEIIYTGRFWPKSPYPDMPYETSRILFKNGRLEVNNNGFVYDPTALTVSGNRAGERAADMLPFEYKPPGSTGDGAAPDLDELYFHMLDSLSTVVEGKGLLREQEEVSISTDKPYYLAGDELWFSARLVDGFNRQPEEGDRIIYVDMISPNDSVIVHQTLPCAGGIASGKITLPDYLPDGCYLLRGYTDWMRNFSDAGFSGKTLMVHSGINNQYIESGKASGDSVTLNFYPEGGNLLNSVKGVVAFRAAGSDGEGLLIKGTLIDDRGREIEAVESNAQGIGKFNFEPREDRTYFVKIDKVNPGARDLRYRLPEIKESGYGMVVVNREKFYFTVHVESTRDLKNHGLILVAQAGGRIFFREAFFLEGTGKTIQMFKSLFPEGTLQLNLFDIEGNFVGQRLVYVDHVEDKPVLTIKTTKPEYNPDESVSLQINLENNVHNPIIAGVSVSVTANDIFSTTAFASPLPEIMIRSGFYEGIENARYYLRDTTSATREELDNLMLTLTQYRYDWRRINGMEEFKFKKTESIKVSGTVFDNKKTCEECKVNLYPVTQGMNHVALTTDNDGNFETSVPGLFDSATYMVEIINAKGKKIEGKISIDNDKPFKTGNRYHDCLNQVTSEEVENYDSVLMAIMNEEEYMNTILLKEISITKKAIVDPYQNDKPKISGLYSLPDQVIDLRKNGDQYTSMAQALMQNLTGFTVSFDPVWGNHKFILHGFNVIPQDSLDLDPLYIVDGVELPENSGYEEINTINPGNVDHIEVYKDVAASFWGARGGNGVIAIFTKKGPDINPATPKQLLKIAGFSPEIIFQPLGQDSTGLSVDKKITVFWADNLYTDSSGNININFKNASNASYFTVHVEGITSEGVPFSIVERTNH
jgi:hypothetical protein